MSELTKRVKIDAREAFFNNPRREKVSKVCQKWQMTETISDALRTIKTVLYSRLMWGKACHCTLYLIQTHTYDAESSYSY
jgi:hypothetical protein